jgi:very-short-patch-repair endonuclease
MKREMFYGASNIIFKNAEKLRANQTQMEEYLWIFSFKKSVRSKI